MVLWPLLSHVLPVLFSQLDEMSLKRRTKTNYLNYAGDICWEIEFHDCLFVVIAVYCKQRRSKELSLLHAQ